MKEYTCADCDSKCKRDSPCGFFNIRKKTELEKMLDEFWNDVSFAEIERERVEAEQRHSEILETGSQYWEDPYNPHMDELIEEDDMRIWENTMDGRREEI